MMCLQNGSGVEGGGGNEQEGFRGDSESDYISLCKYCEQINSSPQECKILNRVWLLSGFAFL